jgi:dihydrofolate reductase
MKKISIIVAVAKNWAIGKNNQLLWHIPADLKRFKQITLGHQLIMGRLTYLSLPVRPLKNRTSIVITDNPDEKFDGCIMVYSIQEAMQYCNDTEETFIIGGGSVYRQFLPHANKLYLTVVERDFDADTFFPAVDEKEWKMVDREDHGPDEHNDFSYSFRVYEK